MHKVVIDTNIVVSSIINQGYPNKILYYLVSTKKIMLHISPSVLKEYYSVLSRPKFSKYKNFKSNAEFILSNIKRVSKIFLPDIRLNVILDKTDNKFLELAVFSKADFIITGNTNDFNFQEYNGIKIVSPKIYWETYWKK